jgi:glycerophosphoryl diester phosphodiesterase
MISLISSKVTQKKVKFQIEIKNDPLHPDWTVSPAEFARCLGLFLCQNNLLERAEIQSFDWQPLYELQKLNKNIKTDTSRILKSKSILTLL